MTDPEDRVQEADERYREITEEIADVGDDRVRAVADAYDEATRLLERYRGQATGTGGEEFRKFVKLQAELEEFVEGLDDDLPRRSAFERMEDRLDKRRVSESDFENARDAVDDARDVATLPSKRKQALEDYREARGDLRAAIDEAEAEIDDLERLQELGEADLEAPVRRLREPIEEYNAAVREAFEAFKKDESAKEVFAFVAATQDYPLVSVDQPPEDLAAYVENSEAGSEPIPTLLEYSEYSRSKLDHYVDEAGELKRRVTTQQTYLRRLDAEPLTVGWPPPTAERLRFRAEELVAVCSRFAPENVVEHARRVRDLPRELEYDRLREAAVAQQRLDEADRERIESGDLARELEELRERRETLTDLLERYPQR